MAASSLVARDRLFQGIFQLIIKESEGKSESWEGKKDEAFPCVCFSSRYSPNSLRARSHHPLLAPLACSPAPFLKSVLPVPALGQFVEEAGKSVSIHFTIALIQTERRATNLILSVYGTLARDRKRSPVKNLPATATATAINSFTCYLLPQFKYKKFHTFSFMVQEAVCIERIDLIPHTTYESFLYFCVCKLAIFVSVDSGVKMAP